jgi:DNA-binding IclR family transcriptional regulator
MPESRGGTQSIERSIRLMRALASRSRFGWRLSDLARHCDMDKGTARRILNCLVRERLAERSAVDQRYLPGPLMYELGLALPDYEELRLQALPVLAELASRTGTVAFLCLRSDDDVVCVDRVGDLPDQAFTLNPGVRRPMINSAAGAALLAEMPSSLRDPIFERNCEVLVRSGSSRAMLQRLLNRSVEEGMGWNESCFVPGWNSYACVVHHQQQGLAAVMISAPSAHFAAGQLEHDIACLRLATVRLQEVVNRTVGRSRRLSSAECHAPAEPVACGL